MKVKDILVKVANELNLEEEIKLLEIGGMNHNIENLINLLNMGARDLVASHNVKIYRGSQIYFSKEHTRLPLTCFGDNWIEIVGVTKNNEPVNYKIEDGYIVLEGCGMYDVQVSSYPISYYIDDELESELDCYVNALRYYMSAFASAINGPLGFNVNDSHTMSIEYYDKYISEIARVQ